MDWYEVLGLKRDASQREIKESYRRLVKMYHPDVGEMSPGKQEMFILVQEAYEIIGNPQERAIYDRSLGYREAPGVLQDDVSPPDSHPFFDFFSAMRLYKRGGKGSWSG